MAGAATIQATDTNIGDYSKITISNRTPGHTVLLGYRAEFDTEWTHIFQKQAVDSYDWLVPDELYVWATYRTVRVQLACITYNGDQKVGNTQTCWITVTTDEVKCKPEITIEVYDTDYNVAELTGGKKILLGYSDFNTKITNTPKYNAEIKSATLEFKKNDGTTVFTIKRNVTSGHNCNEITYKRSDTDVSKVKVTTVDSRGYENTAEAELEVIDYFKPSIRAQATRTTPTSDVVKITAEGKFFNNKFGTESDESSILNELKVRVKCKPNTDIDWTTEHTETEMNVTVNGNSFKAELDYKGLEHDTIYTVRVLAADKICERNGIDIPVYTDITVKKGIPTFDWGESDFRFNVPVAVRGEADSDGNVIYNPIFHTGNLKIATGKAEVASAGATEPGSVKVTFPSGMFTKAPIVFVTPDTSSPGSEVTGTSVGNITNEDCNIYMSRTTLTVTGVYWLAIEI